MKNHYLNKLLKYLQLNAKQFSESLNFERADRIYNVLNYKNGLSSSLAKIIVNAYPTVSYDWLLTGEGEMIKTGNITNTKAKKIIEKDKIIIELKRAAELYQQKIVSLETHIKDLEKLLKEKEEIIEKLRN